jgi:hypothetical protein
VEELMVDPAILLGMMSDATHARVDFWLNWLILGSAGPALVLTWIEHRKKHISLRIAVLAYAVWGSMFVKSALELLHIWVPR